MRDIFVVEHRDMPVPDRGQRHLAERGFRVCLVAPFRDETLPELGDDTAGVLIMGGPQYVTDLDEFPYLRDEMEFVGRVMEQNIPLLGICLGGQLIAAHLGAEVDDHPEGHTAFGYYPLRPTEPGKGIFPEDLHVPAGNAQGFAIPRSATLLAEGEVFPNQAFSVGERTHGLQFHPELTRPILDLWQDVLAANYGRPGTQSKEVQDAGFAAHDGRLHDWYTAFLDIIFRS
ncbi:MAG: gamma-glutamyl-gamma-aminobutyrate hydrolase family protein [Alphaproteobacteria bacterium]|jgi:GMP synthase (glutamine-hydrolysing)|nr:gamma-glutamyl-gamma-aminobutyrate hydrolase family protein [Alphaproteobacteria bacterium]|tara:strand:- start:255 stop:944 length:690 start_codon:yes stop_codon:yes gene_type:complete